MALRSLQMPPFDEESIGRTLKNCFDSMKSSILRIASYLPLEKCKMLKDYKEFLSYLNLFPINWQTLKNYRSEEVIQVSRFAFEVEYLV